jgi:hypothetical protein
MITSGSGMTLAGAKNAGRLLVMKKLKNTTRIQKQPDLLAPPITNVTDLAGV